MCTNEYKKYAGCGHTVLAEHKCPAFNKRKNRMSTREQCPNFKRMDVDEPYKCNKFGEDYCVKAVPKKEQKIEPKVEEKNTAMAMDEDTVEKPAVVNSELLTPKKMEQKDVSMAMGDDVVKKPAVGEPIVKGGLLNPKGKKMAWENSDDEDDNDVEMQIDTAAKEDKKPKNAPSYSSRGRGRGRGRGRRY